MGIDQRGVGRSKFVALAFRKGWAPGSAEVEPTKRQGTHPWRREHRKSPTSTLTRRLARSSMMPCNGSRACNARRDTQSWKEDIGERVQELARRLYQGHLDMLFFRERERVHKGRKPPGEVRIRTRDLETRFGRVAVRRHGFRTKGASKTVLPLDRALRLPSEMYSHGLRKHLAEEVRTQSVAQSVERIDKTTAGHIPKRQAEQLMVRAAQDFGHFYAMRERQDPANDSCSPTSLLMLSSDGKGIAMVSGGLRDATRKDAARETRDAVRGDPTSTRKDRRHTKRMATVTAVWDQKPLARTAADIITELHGNPEAKKVRMPRPERKRVAATVEKTLLEAVCEVFDEADRREPEQQRTTGVVIDGNEHQLAVIKAEAASAGVRSPSSSICCTRSTTSGSPEWRFGEVTPSGPTCG